MHDGEARDWLDKEPPRSILTWDDLVSKFINQYFPPSKTTYYRNEIITFYQKPNEAFNEAWERFKGLLRQCPHHGFSELHQLDTFYNSLNSNDQDALDSAAGGNFLDKMPQEGLAIIESKSKVRYSRSRANDSRVSTDAPLSNSSPSNNSFDMQQIAASLEDKMTIKMNQMMSQMKALVVTPAPVKAVEEVCVTCGSNHNFNHCPLTRSGNDFPVFQDNIQQFQQTAAIGNFLQRNQPSNLASQMRPPDIDSYWKWMAMCSMRFRAVGQLIVSAGNQTNKNAGPQETNGNTGLKKTIDAGQTEEENVSSQQYIVFLLWSSISSSHKSSDDKAKDYTVNDDACRKTIQEPASEYDQALKNVLDNMMDQEKEATEQSDAVRKEFEAQCDSQEKITRASSTNSFNTVSTPVNTASASRTFSLVGPSSRPSFVPFGGSFPIDVANIPHDPLMPKFEDTTEIHSTGIFNNAYDDHDLETLNTPYVDQSVGAETDFNNMEPSTVVSPIPTTRVHFIHPKAQIIGDPKSAVQTRGMTKKNSREHAMISYIQKQRRTNHKDF
ncbi:reverse transcriptase domain-containing protein [Tanacetum coccineum]